MAILTVAARDLRPGDWLPPQVALHASPFQDTGLTIGNRPGDVLRSAAVSGLVMIWPDGALRSFLLREDTQVIVHRHLPEDR